MRLILRSFFILLCSFAFSQRSPQVVLKDDSNLKLIQLKVEVNITGNFATTTYDMKFYNGLDRTLEGELVFPLGEGQAVSRFAMDVNGKLREAVIVEKELARVAYESTVRQTIDPGLLEKTDGNNYKARVYPILPKSYKHIVITYEQELFTTNENLVYELPLGIDGTIDVFSVDIYAYTNKMPIPENNPYNLIFRKKENAFKAHYDHKQVAPKNPIIIKIPNTSGQEHSLTYQDYFYINKSLNPNLKLKDKPKHITILWDASYSMQHRNLDEELKLLGNYMNYLQDVNVSFVSFSNAVHSKETFNIKKGQWRELKAYIKAITYDGGTAFNMLKNLNAKTDEVLLFTDGLSNLGSPPENHKTAVYTINSVVSANHSNLNKIATHSGGNYINLIRLSHQDALKLLKHDTYQFLGISNNTFVNELYPNKNTNVSNDFSITGRFSKNTTIELLFGYGGKVTERIPIDIGTSSSSTLVKRLWAKQKLKTLHNHKKDNRETIIAHAKQYHLISDYTSMLILDRLEDYVRYRIEPPQELKRDYKRRIEELDAIEAERTSELQERRADLFEDYKGIEAWYHTTYPIPTSKPKKTVQNRESNTATGNQTLTQSTSQLQTNRPINQNRRRFEVDSTKRIVSGTIVDATGIPLAGVNVYLKGTSKGTITDFDGHFAINAETTDALVCSYIGFTTKEINTNHSTNLSIKMEEDSATLDEVVVVGYGVQRKSNITASVTQVVVQALSGKVSGVAVTESADNPSIVVRGSAAISNNTPLYIVDGVVSETNPTDQLNPEDIESIQTLNSESATALYGSRASNGLIVIVTKAGKAKNQEAIDKLKKDISEKIELKPWNPETPYLARLQQETTIDGAYGIYLELRKDYRNTPAFFLDVADFFNQRQASEIAIRILSNLIEVELQNHELIRALGYKLEYFKQDELAAIVYEKVLELRPEEPQSYRDLALVYERIGKVQKSFDLLFKLYHGDLLEKDEDERYYGIEHIAFVELKRLLAKHKNQLQLSDEQATLLNPIPVDVRVVIDWNHNDTDIDLWVIDPNGEKAYFDNDLSNLGGRLSEDLMEGYGPEEFMLKKAISGNYQVMVDYYSDNVQKIAGPTILKVTLFTNYGRDNEKRETLIVRLDKEADEIEVGSIQFNN